MIQVFQARRDQAFYDYYRLLGISKEEDMELLEGCLEILQKDPWTGWMIPVSSIGKPAGWFSIAEVRQADSALWQFFWHNRGKLVSEMMEKGSLERWLKPKDIVKFFDFSYAETSFSDFRSVKDFLQALQVCEKFGRAGLMPRIGGLLTKNPFWRKNALQVLMAREMASWPST